MTSDWLVLGIHIFLFIISNTIFELSFKCFCQNERSSCLSVAWHKVICKVWGIKLKLYINRDAEPPFCKKSFPSFPLLFLIYINDIVYSSTILKFYLFADDTTLLYSSKQNPKTQQEIINTELKKVTAWLNCNKLSLNIDKSCYLKFSLLPSHIFSLRMANKTLVRKSVTKYLGVLIDDKLNWKDHIQNINLKIRKGIGLLYKLNDLVTSSTLKSLYFSFVYPYLDYNLLNWSTASNSNLNCLRLSNKKAVHTILSKYKYEHAALIFSNL